MKLGRFQHWLNTNHFNIRLLTMVDCQDLPTVHPDKAAQRKLGVTDAQLLCPLKCDPLQDTQIDDVSVKRDANI